MNPEIKSKWIAALRSGNYQQGKYSLNHNNEFCCLGVLCDISKISDWIGGPTATYLNEQGALPSQVIQWAGMQFDPQFTINHLEHPLYMLATMNDSGRPFSEIADWIEANL